MLGSFGHPVGRRKRNMKFIYAPAMFIMITQMRIATYARAAVTAAFLGLCATPWVNAESALKVDFNAQGITELVWNDYNYLESGKLSVTKAFFVTPNGNVYEAGLATETAFHPEQNEYVFMYPWGTVSIHPKTEATRILYSVTVENHHETDSLVGIYLELGTLRFPEAPEIENKSWLFYTQSNMGHNLGQPGIVAARSSAGTVVVCNEQLSEPLATGFGITDKQNPSVLPILVYTARHPMALERFPYIERLIRPNGRDVFSISVRFTPRDETLVVTVKDLYQKFANLYPFELDWPDRRPIGRAFLSSAGQNWANNPRGWHHGFGGAQLDINSDTGKKEFVRDLLKYADRAIEIAVRNNAQGIIIWDIEGQQYPHSTSFLGDPRSLPPEMRLPADTEGQSKPVIDVFFKKITDAGIIPGICIRPQQPMRPVYGDAITQVAWSDHRDRVNNVAEKINFARKQWGCRLFYLDSDIEWKSDPVAIPGATGHSALRDPALLREIRRRFPDVLIMPEWEDLQTYAVAAPYSQLNYNKLCAPPDDVLATYPKAFLVNSVDMQNGEENLEHLIQAIRRGDIFFYTAWYDAPENKFIQTIYTKAQQTSDQSQLNNPTN